LSIIREGSGYWKYIPTAEGIRFLTWHLFGYRGSFKVEWRKVTAGEVPSHILPQRQERRD
jgi:hypothetical protein